MTPKEKALDLKVKMFERIPDCVENDYAIYVAKECAIKAVDEMIKEHTFKHPISWNVSRLTYWNAVKEELNKL